MIPLEVLCRDAINLLKGFGRPMFFKTQNRYFLDREGKAEAMSRAKMPELGTFLTM